MIRDIPQSNWVDFLMDFAKDHQGKMVELYIEDDQSRNILGRDPLISFEGDCNGEIVNGVKMVIGTEGDNPDNLFHNVKSPQTIQVEENENGVIRSITLTDDEGLKTILEVEV